MAHENGHDAVERTLRGYYAAERDALRPPEGLWAAVHARLGEQAPAPWWQRIFGGAGGGMGRVYAGAAAALVVAIVGVAMLVTVMDDGRDSAASMQGSPMSSAAADAPALAAMAPATETTDAAAAAPAADAAPMAAMAEADAMQETIPRAASDPTMDASSGAAAAAGVTFRQEVWALQGNVRSHLFWVALPEGWRVGEPARADDAWSGVITGPGIALHYTFGERTQTRLLLTEAEAAEEAQLRAWDEYVVGNLAVFIAPPEGQAGGVQMALQLPRGTLRITAEALTPAQQSQALMVFRSIIA